MDFDSRIQALKGGKQIKPGKEFLSDFALYERRYREEGYTDEDIAEIKEQVRTDWEDAELRELWKNAIKQEADFMRSLFAMGKGICGAKKASPAHQEESV